MEYRLSFEHEEREEKKCNQKQLEEKEIERSTQLTAWRPSVWSERVSWPRFPFRFYSPNETCLLMPYNSLQLLLLIHTACNSDISQYFSLQIPSHQIKYFTHSRFVTKHHTTVAVLRPCGWSTLKVNPVQTYIGSESSWRLRLPGFSDNRQINVAGQLYSQGRISRIPSGIEPATIRLVNQCLSQLHHHAAPEYGWYVGYLTPLHRLRRLNKRRTMWEHAFREHDMPFQEMYVAFFKNNQFDRCRLDLRFKAQWMREQNKGQGGI